MCYLLAGGFCGAGVAIYLSRQKGEDARDSPWNHFMGEEVGVG
jgi:hypothetical protein